MVATSKYKVSTATSTIAYHHHDHLGGEHVDTDSAGATLEYTIYSPYGSIQKTSGTTGYLNANKFTGKQVDKDTNFYYYGARYYSANYGRFLSEDNVFLAVGEDNSHLRDPQSLDSYSYARNNPLRFVDPDGNFFSGFGDIAILGIDIGFLMHDNALGAGIGTMAADVGFLALDTISTLIPGVPAGAGAAAHGMSVTGKAAEAVVKAGQAARITKATLSAERRSAVKDAWKAESKMVSETGSGTRRWDAAQTSELSSRGKVSGYEGHHINSVSGSPHLAGDASNIKFLTRLEHLAEHSGNWTTKTFGDLLKR